MARKSMKDNIIHIENPFITFSRGVSASNSQCKCMPFSLPESTKSHPACRKKGVRLCSCRTQKQPLVRPWQCDGEANSGFLRNACGLQNKAQTVHLEINLLIAECLAVSCLPACQSWAQSYMVVLKSSHSELVSCYVWIFGVSDSPSQLVHYLNRRFNSG